MVDSEPEVRNVESVDIVDSEPDVRVSCLRSGTRSSTRDKRLAENIQMEEFDKKFNPEGSIKLMNNQCEQCGVIIAEKSRLPSHHRFHTCEDTLVCRLPGKDGNVCNKPCIAIYHLYEHWTKYHDTSAVAMRQSDRALYDLCLEPQNVQCVQCFVYFKIKSALQFQPIFEFIDF